jgi:hypothetical protein
LSKDVPNQNPGFRLFGGIGNLAYFYNRSSRQFGVQENWKSNPNECKKNSQPAEQTNMFGIDIRLDLKKSICLN